jgi:dephospho-CoA kinase
VKLAVGLTGGIGSGKTTVGDRLAALGATLVDSDAISRALTAAGGAAIEPLREAFGAAAIGADGALDRAAMRELAFADPAARARLEAVLHPLIRAESDRARHDAAGPYVVMVVPLLFETGGHARVSRTLVVDVPEAVQVSRVIARSALPEPEVRAIMAAQWPRWRRLQAADDVIWNGGEPGALGPQCERVHARYVEMSRSPA